MSRTSLFEMITQDPVELNSLILKSKLAAIIGMMVSSKGWTQTKVSDVLKISQPRVSNLLKGRLDKFSIDALFEFLFRLGYKLDMDFTPQNDAVPLSMSIKKAVL
jgi:predicted XRE-type DNA-binding protein